MGLGREIIEQEARIARLNSKVPAGTLKVGDKVMPPARELRLWMRRALAEKNLPESALALTIREIVACRDAKGEYFWFKCDHAPEWYGPHKPYEFSFKTRPATLWPKLP